MRLLATALLTLLMVSLTPVAGINSDAEASALDIRQESILPR
jgi:hypothetical protein